MSHSLPIECNSCIHRLTNSSCRAFSQIPEDIVVWAAPHDKPTPSQKNEIVWQFKPGKESELEDWKSLQNAGRTK
jgi:hypothetical protein